MQASGVFAQSFRSDIPMVFTVQHSSSDGKARAGVLATPSGPIATPGLLCVTHRGGVLNLTPDLLEKLGPDVQGVQVDVLHFLTQPRPEVLRGFSGPGRRFLALDSPGWVLVATGRDPTVYEYQGAMRQATDQSASISIHTGAASVTPVQYMEAVAALAPDVWVALSDDIPCDSRSDRCTKAVDRTAAWLGECLKAAAAAPELAGAAAFAAVQGGRYVHERVRCAEAVAAQPGVSGFLLGGLGTGESPELRHTLVEEVLARLPPAAPRMLAAVGTPEEVLDAVAQGVDLFDCSHVASLVAGGYALSFPLTPEDDEAQQAQQAQQARQGQRLGAPFPAAAAAVAAAAAAGAAGAAAGQGGSTAADVAAGAWQGGGTAADEAADAGQDDSKLNLWALAYRTDRRPLLPGCPCYTCANHTRAYIHHLLQAHEMTAQVLLEMHNTHHYLRFFHAIRSAIAAGTFGAYHASFLQRRQRWLVEGR